MPELLLEKAEDHSQAYFWSSRWQQGERQAQEDIQVRLYQDFKSAEDFIQALQEDMDQDVEAGDVV